MNSLSFFSLGLLADTIQFDASVRTSVRLLTQMNCAIMDQVCQAWSHDGEAALQSSHTLEGSVNYPSEKNLAELSCHFQWFSLHWLFPLQWWSIPGVNTSPIWQMIITLMTTRGGSGAPHQETKMTQWIWTLNTKDYRCNSSLETKKLKTMDYEYN